MNISACPNLRACLTCPGMVIDPHDLLKIFVTQHTTENRYSVHANAHTNRALSFCVPPNAVQGLRLTSADPIKSRISICISQQIFQRNTMSPASNH